jgi:hypothetical protein
MFLNNVDFPAAAAPLTKKNINSRFYIDMGSSGVALLPTVGRFDVLGG